MSSTGTSWTFTIPNEELPDLFKIADKAFEEDNSREASEFRSDWRLSHPPDILPYDFPFFYGLRNREEMELYIIMRYETTPEIKYMKEMENPVYRSVHDEKVYMDARAYGRWVLRRLRWMQYLYY
jgi:hypothetical protein